MNQQGKNTPFSIMNVILGRKPIFSYLGKSLIDNIEKRFSPMVRFAVRLIVLIAATIIYF